MNETGWFSFDQTEIWSLHSQGWGFWVRAQKTRAVPWYFIFTTQLWNEWCKKKHEMRRNHHRDTASYRHILEFCILHSLLGQITEESLLFTRRYHKTIGINNHRLQTTSKSSHEESSSVSSPNITVDFIRNFRYVNQWNKSWPNHAKCLVVAFTVDPHSTSVFWRIPLFFIWFFPDLILTRLRTTNDDVSEDQQDASVRWNQLERDHANETRIHLCSDHPIYRR